MPAPSPQSVGASRHGPARRSIGVRLWRSAGTPWATLLFGGLLTALLASRGGSFNGNWPSGAPSGGSGVPSVPHAMVVRDGPGAYRIVPSADLVRADRVVGQAWYAYRSRPADPSRAWTELETVVVDAGVPEADVPVIRGLYIDWLGTLGTGYWKRAADRLRAGDIAEHDMGGRVLYWLAPALLACLTLRSLEWTRPIIAALGRALGRFSPDPAERARRKRRAALAAARCPGCGYSIRGLRQRRCPECAHTWSAPEQTLVDKAG